MSSERLDGLGHLGFFHRQGRKLGRRRQLSRFDRSWCFQKTFSLEFLGACHVGEKERGSESTRSPVAKILDLTVAMSFQSGWQGFATSEQSTIS